MGLSEKEYINALNQFIEDISENDHCNEIAILRNLIKDYFELKDKYEKILDEVHDYRYSEHASKMIIRNLCKHFGVNSAEELQNIYINKPYKLEDLKHYMEVFDNERREICYVDMDYGTPPWMCYGNNEYNCRFEEKRFFPLAKAGEVEK